MTDIVKYVLPVSHTSNSSMHKVPDTRKHEASFGRILITCFAALIPNLIAQLHWFISFVYDAILAD